MNEILTAPNLSHDPPDLGHDEDMFLPRQLLSYESTVRLLWKYIQEHPGEFDIATAAIETGTTYNVAHANVQKLLDARLVVPLSGKRSDDLRSKRTLRRLRVATGEELERAQEGPRKVPAVKETTVPPHRDQREYPEEVFQAALAAYDERATTGETVADLARRFGVSAGTLTRWGRERSNRRVPRDPDRKTHEAHDPVMRDYDAGQTDPYVLAELHDVSVPTVRRWIKRRTEGAPVPKMGRPRLDSRGG